jgi:hypothetical protein
VACAPSSASSPPAVCLCSFGSGEGALRASAAVCRPGLDPVGTKWPERRSAARHFVAPEIAVGGVRARGPSCVTVERGARSRWIRNPRGRTPFAAKGLVAKRAQDRVWRALASTEAACHRVRIRHPAGRPDCRLGPQFAGSSDVRTLTYPPGARSDPARSRTRRVMSVRLPLFEVLSFQIPDAATRSRRADPDAGAAF